VHGDTLYSIAWEAGRDYRELSEWNNIPPPFLIKPGQVIRLYPPEKREPRVASVDTAAAAAPAAPAAGAIPKKSSSSTKKQKGSARKPDTKANTKPKTTAKPAPTPVPAHARSGSWQWPAAGSLIARFQESNGRKGIDIAGQRGQPVSAAEGGRVVYQGSGLRGYGQLIIIKHDDDYLSAYAHNAKVHVKEGDVVKRGQRIADMGDSGTDRVKLHFEIRRQGMPVDPLRYLPAR
jgi:lipoprotein NlpD